MNLTLNLALWIVAGLLAVVFLVSSTTTLFVPKEMLAAPRRGMDRRRHRPAATTPRQPRRPTIRRPADHPCDHAVRQGLRSLPRVPRHPRRIHWSIPDPASVSQTEQGSYLAFRHAAADIDIRIRHLLPVLGTHHEEVQP